MRPVVLGLLAAALVLTGCAPGAGRSRPEVSLGSAAIPLADIRADPQRFVARAITTRGTVVTTGRSSGSQWIDLVDTKEGGRLTFLLAATAEVKTSRTASRLNPGVNDRRIGDRLHCRASRARIRCDSSRLRHAARRGDSACRLDRLLTAAGDEGLQTLDVRS